MKPLRAARLRGAFLLALPLTGFAGQSLVVDPSTSLSVADPPISEKKSWRIEFQIHDWKPPAQGNYGAQLFYLPGTGARVRIYPDSSIEFDTTDQVAERQPCFVALGGRKDALVRLQKDVAARRVSCEIWNYDGSAYANMNLTLTD